MGHSWSSRRRRRHRHEQLDHHQNHYPSESPPPPPPPPSSNPPPATLPPPPPPPPQPQPPSPSPPPSTPPPSYAFAANAPYPTPPQNPYPALPTPSPPPSFQSYTHQSNSYNYYNNYARPMMMMGQQPNYNPNHNPYFPNQSNGWPGFRPPPPLPLPPPPPVPYVGHQSAKKIKNDVNVHKDTIRVELDENNPDCHLITFTFDAVVDGSITIFYFGKEGENCRFTPLYPEIYMPFRIPFHKGAGQKFRQPSGTGIDLGFFDVSDLSKPLTEEEVFPLVISAESHSGMPSPAMDEPPPKEPPVTTPSHAQITQAVLEKNHDGPFKVKVIKQILWIDGVSYELREIYGIGNLGEATVNDNDSGKECVICMTDPKDTAVLPCRHMCMCSECAKALRLQSNKCPICRQPIEELMEIKVDEGN